MAVDEPAVFDEAYPETRPHGRRRHRRHHVTWSPDQLLDPMVLVATAPMALFPERFPREAFLIAAALLVVPYIVRKSNTGSFTVLTPMLWPLLVILVIILPINVWKSPSFWAVSWPEFVRFVWGMAVLLGVANWCAAGADQYAAALRRRIGIYTSLATAAYFALGVTFTAVGMLAIRSTSKVPLLGDLVGLLPEATWLPESIAQGFNANRVAGMAVLFLPLALGITLGPLGRRGMTAASVSLKVAAVVLVLFFGSALLLTQSRAALLAGGIAVILVSILAGRRGLLPLMLIAIVAVAALDVFGPSGLVSTFSVDSDAAIVEAGEQPSLIGRVLNDRNVAGRIVIWRRALHGIADEPLTGMGLAGFEAISQQPYAAMPDWEPDPDVVHAHNLFLQTGLDMGIPGLLALLALVAVAIWETVGMLRGTSRVSTARFWTIGVAGSLCAFVLYNMLDSVSVGARPSISYWYLFGLIAGACAALRFARYPNDAY